MKIRTACEQDFYKLLEIYNYEVESGVATLDLVPKTEAQWREWFDSHNIKNHPLIVAEVGGECAGYASLSQYREKEAYKTTTELSVYVSPFYRNRGVATALMDKIIRIAREDATIHTVVSVITAGNEASVKLHSKFGFEFCGTIREVGEKFGKYLDIENYSLLV